jgi:hypothetical protein
MESREGRKGTSREEGQERGRKGRIEGRGEVTHRILKTK